MTPLDKTLKRALKIYDRDYVIAIDPQMLKVTEKGRRIGLELKWGDIVSGESALAVALHASVGKFQNPTSASTTNKTLKPIAHRKASLGGRATKKRAR